MSGWRAVPYTLLWGAARGLDLSARAAMYLAAGILRLSDLRHGIASAWAEFGRHEAAILSGLMPWEETLYGHALKPDDRIFLIGCGTGRDLIALLERGHQVSGLDPAPGVVALAREMLAREGLAAELQTASIETAALPGSFDAFVFSWYCYGYIPQMDNRVGVLRKLKAHLNPGGRIVISYIPADPSLRRLPIRLTRLMARLTRSDWRPELGDALGTASGRPGAVHYEHHFTEGELEREARAAGLGVAFHERADDGTAILTGP
jgi:SAM-dependent methyltransferase